MDKIKNYLKLRNELLDIFIDEMNDDKKTKNFDKLIGLIPLMHEYDNGITEFLWSDVYERAINILHIDINDPKDINRVKSIVNRRLSNLEKNNVLVKVKLENDKRKVKYILTEDIKKLFDKVIARIKKG